MSFVPLYSRRAACVARWKLLRISRCLSHSPNPPLDLDPDLRSLLKDAEMSLVRHTQKLDLRPPPREIHAMPSDMGHNTEELDVSMDVEFEIQNERLERKSPAAAFGSDSIGHVVLPDELQDSIRMLIADSDKLQLRGDAKRLFEQDDESGSSWEWNYGVKYRSHVQREKRGTRDGTAFASIALPAHYSAIVAVLSHLKHRLGRQWQPSRVTDWGSGAGSSLWACLHTFQRSDVESLEPASLSASNTTISSYNGIEKRDGLTSIARRLVENANLERAIKIKWNRSFLSEEGERNPNGSGLLAISAFALSSISTDVAKKKMLKELWQSGAEMMVLIDHGTPAGFEAIAEARRFLLGLGKRELEEPDVLDSVRRGAHVVAPCPHDDVCPLYRNESPTKLLCSFEQRLQSPDFVRRTKHSKRGHEDIGYSYVAIRRGPRPTLQSTKVGRVGEVGRRAIIRELERQAPIRELQLHDTPEVPSVPTSPHEDLELESAEEPVIDRDVEDQLRAEAYHWPRLIFPPLKKGGHVILDSCTPEGHIMRLTVPRSQGKQEYYDARKSAWGDIFPHPPKNRPQLRVSGSQTEKGGASVTAGNDIGKRKQRKTADQTSYDKLSESIKGSQQKRKRKVSSRRNKRDLDDE